MERLPPPLTSQPLAPVPSTAIERAAASVSFATIGRHQDGRKWGERSTTTPVAGALPLVVDGVAVHFGGIAALRDTSIEVPPGEIVGLIGPNGAGKTTLMNTISGVIRPDQGSIRLFNTKIHPGGWRNFLDYANGTLGDWGVHWFDHVLWWNGGKYPQRIFCSGGRPVAGPAVHNEKEQTTDAPDHQAAIYEFEDFTCTWEHRHFAGNNAEKHSLGAYFYGTKGILHIGWRDGWTFYPADSQDKIVHENSQLEEPDGHNIKILWADFLDSIEQKRAPAAGIEIGHRASVLPLLGMLSWKLGRSIQWDGEKETIVDDPKATELLSRPYRTPWQYPTT